MQTTAKSFHDILKFNPYHDRLGRFASGTGGNATSFTWKPGQGSKYDKAIAREKERTAEIADTSGIEHKKSVPELEDELRSMLDGAAYVNLDGMNDEAAESLVKNTKKVMEKYPFLKDEVLFFELYDMDDKTYAVYSNSGIYLNSRKFAGTKEQYEAAKYRYERDVRWDFHPKGTTIESTVVHELGHAVDSYLSRKVIDKNSSSDKNVSSRIQKKILDNAEKSGEKVSLMHQLSLYSEHNHEEFFAEAFSEAISSPKPRNMAQSVMNELNTYIDAYNRGETI